MKFKNCSDEKRLSLRKASVKRMHRPHKFEAMQRGRQKIDNLMSRIGCGIDRMHST